MRSICMVSALVALLLSGGSSAGPKKGTAEIRTRVEKIRASAPGTVAGGTLDTALAYLASADNFEKKDPAHAKRMITLSERIVEAAERREDLIADQRGFFWRGYSSRFAPHPEMYSIYVPKWYDPSKKWPLIVSLHGGSSNHNVWMAGLLGHNITPPEYRKNFRTPYRANVHQDEAIIVAPQGMGQNHWLGEAQQDVMDVIEDVRRHYNIDNDKVFLNGLSNGAVASYKIGLGNAWQFAAVIPMSGIVDWEAHASGGASGPAERIVLRNESSLTIAENAFNTNLIYYHGVKDSGFDISQARKLAKRLKKLGIASDYHEIPHLGHHLTHLLWNDMKILTYVRRNTRPKRPNEVRLVSVSERANRQFWVLLNDRLDHRTPGEIRAKVGPANVVNVEAENARRFTLLLDEAPVSGKIKIRVNGQLVDLGPFTPGKRITLQGEVDRGGKTVWNVWDHRRLDPTTHKRARLSGPLGDAAWEAQVHVYGTGVPEDTATLKKAAELGARGWTRDWEFTQVRHPVIPDTALTPDMLQDRALVLYGNAKNNAVLKEIGQKLPIRVGDTYIELRDQRLTDSSTGAKFVCPNPLRPDRYLIVQAGNSAGAVERGGNLPMFLPDYVVFDKRFTSPSQKMALTRQTVIETGFFTEAWRLGANTTTGVK